MIRTSACHNHRLYQHTERADRDCDKYEDTQRFQFRKCDIFELLPAACVVHLSRLIERGIDVLQTAQKDDHLVADTLPYAHDRDGGKRLIGTVDKRLRVDTEVPEQRI